MAPQLSLRAFFSYASNLLSQIPLAFPGIAPFGPSDVIPYQALSNAPSCPLDGPVSCHNSTPIAGDSCCFIYPSGRLLLAQFWDEEVHAGGAEEDWTLHGLWPDLCDGSYDAYCGMTPRFNNITEILAHYGQEELIGFMDRYWVASYGSNAHLWSHEYNKHASCINTLSPSCYGDAYTPGMEVVDYFTRAFGLFRTLDSFTALSQAGIVPTHEKTYPLAQVQEALEGFSGGRVVLRCSGRGRDVLHEAWYVYFVKGSVQTGEFVPAKGLGAHGDAGNCAAEVKYVPKRCRGGDCGRTGEL